MRKLIFFVFTVLLLGSSALAQEMPACREDSTPRLHVLSAFGSEWTLLKEDVQGAESCWINGVEFVTGTLMGNDIVLYLSGVSMVNAAMTPQLALDHFPATGMVFSGIAGGVNPELNIGDVVVPARWAQYQEMRFARELSPGVFDLPEGQEIPNFGMMVPNTTTVRSQANPDGEEMLWFPVDEEMLAVAQQVAARVQLANCTDENVCLTHEPRVVVGGNGVAGSTFVDNAEFRAWAYEAFQADSLDMETSATAMVAYANNVPFIAFRSLSDLAGGGEGENEIGTFFQLAADNSAMVVEEFLAAWASS